MGRKMRGITQRREFYLLEDKRTDHNHINNSSLNAAGNIATTATALQHQPAQQLLTHSA
jgi:hypothetical protein